MMSKAHDKNTGMGMVIFGLLLIYGGSTVHVNISQNIILILGIVIFIAGAFILTNAFGVIQIGKAKTPKQQVTGINTKSNAALDALNLRYAKGEITQDQYNQMKKDLGE